MPSVVFDTGRSRGKVRGTTIASFAGWCRWKALDLPGSGPEPQRSKASFPWQALVVILAATLGSFTPRAQAFTALVAFGDSYTDTGNAPSSPPDYFNGRFSNGPLWIEYLAQKLGFAYNSSENFAVSGTESNELGIQIDRFPGTSDSSNVLFAIWSGNNDFGNHFNIGYNDAAWDSQINSVVYSLTTACDLLYQKGARQILLFNQIELTRVPYILDSYSASFRSYFASKIQIFNSRLAQAVPNLLSSHPGLQIYLIDTHSDLNYLLDSYGNLGFTQATLGALNDPNLADTSFSGPGANYVFWDSEHPTTKAHALLAKWVFIRLPAPVPPPPPPPAVSISSPADASTFVAPASVALAANVVSNGWPITQVSFFENGTLVGEASAPPYVLNLTSAAVGDYTFSASLTYGSGSNLTSSPIHVSISAPPGVPLPAPWQHLDIGAVGKAGGANYNSNGTFIVSGSGNDIGDLADAFHFVYQPLVGNATITARITSVEDSDTNAKAGLMFRQNLGSNALNVLAFLTPSAGDGFQNRTTTNGTSTSVRGNPVTPPCWLTLRRTNDVFTGYDSPDGTNWTLLGSVIVPMGSVVYGGFAVTAHNSPLLCTATLDNVQLTHPVPVVPPLLRLTRSPASLLQLNATGSIGATFVWQAATNLSNWRAISTNLNISGTVQIPIPTNAAPRGFFRVLLSPQ